MTSRNALNLETRTFIVRPLYKSFGPIEIDKKNSYCAHIDLDNLWDASLRQKKFEHISWKI